MLKLTKSIALGGVVLLLLINTIISAENCNVSLSRSKCGRVTRIDSGENYAVIQYNPDNTWKTFTMNNGQLTVADSSDTTPSYGKQFDSQLQYSSLDQNLKVSDGELSEEELKDDVSTPETSDTNNAELQKLLSSPLLGAKFSSESGRLIIDGTNGNKWALKSDNGQHVLYNDPQGNNMAVLNLNGNSKYSNILLQNNTLATFVDQQCKIETIPMHKLSYDQAAEIGNMKRRAAQDNSHGRGPNMMPPPPPPLPRPFGPFNPFSDQHSFQQQQQQGSIYQPRQLLRIIPFRGFGQ